MDAKKLRQKCERREGEMSRVLKRFKDEQRKLYDLTGELESLGWLKYEPINAKRVCSLAMKGFRRTEERIEKLWKELTETDYGSSGTVNGYLISEE